MDFRCTSDYSIRNPITGVEVWPKETAVWKYGPEVTRRQQADGRLYWGADGRAAAPRAKLFLSEMDNVVPRSVWGYDDVGHTQEATTELKSLFDGQQVFDSPKPVKLLRRIIDLGCNSADDIVLDFFAGSGTTGHACYSRASDGHPARFILVQLEEPIQNGIYENIADITKARLRQASAKVKSENPAFSGDGGFRVFKLNHSNIRAWNPDPTNLDQALLDHQNHLVEGRTEADIIYEMLLKLGLDLCVPMQAKMIAGKTVGSVAGGVILSCFAKKIGSSEIEALAQGIVAWHKELAPAGDTTCVFRDSAFEDDVTKTNMASILEQNGIQYVRSL